MLKVLEKKIVSELEPIKQCLLLVLSILLNVIILRLKNNNNFFNGIHHMENVTVKERIILRL